LRLNAEAEVERIVDAIATQVFRHLRRKGAVIGLSGGIDSSLAAALCVKALGRSRVLGLLMPEADSSAESLDLGQRLAHDLGIRTVVEDITAILDAAGAYRRRDQAIKSVAPGYTSGAKCKLTLPAVLDGAYRMPSLVIQSTDGMQSTSRATVDAYLTIVSATNFKQRVRKMLEYFYADRLQYAVVGTPNRLEFELGFFVKNGDGAADLKPLAHLYKSQIYQLAEYLEILPEIRRRPPTTDTYSLPQTQDEFYFSLPLETMDLCLYGHTHGVPPSDVARAVNLSEAQIARAYHDIDQKRNTTRYLHVQPLLVASDARSHDNLPSCS
jgi:NAD+ synthase